MMPKHTGEPDLALAGLVLLIIFAFMMWQDRPIQSPRPVDLIDAKQHAPRVTGNFYESWLWQDPFDFDPVVDPLNEKLHKVFQPDNGYVGLQDENSEVNDHCFCHTGLLTQTISNVEPKNATIRIIAPTVPITPNTVETKEFRTRYRYAVVSGLIEAGYRPSNPHSLNFCTSSAGSKYDVRWEQWKLLPSSETKNPGNNKPEYIFVIWSTEKFFSRKITNSTERIHQEDVLCIDSNFDNSVKVCATSPSKKADQYFLHLQSTNRDNPLSSLLKEELGKRNITNPSEIAIISEHDTESIRKFVGKFCEQFGESNGYREISNFTYLKGLDAYRRSTGKQEEQQGIANKAIERRDHLLSIIDQHNLPAGPSQLDYLYRLIRQIKESHNDSDHKKHIKAVGVFGSDFYDKLIIFQVLRAEIPNIVLFTTELDAEMLHPQYWHWTRNLIVATPFDLRLKDKFQKKIPPFRDSLQTQIYFEILRNFEAVTGEAPPLVFEIGRNKIAYLTGNSSNSDSVHPDYSSDNRLNEQLLLWTLIVGAFIFIVQQIKPHSGVLIFWLLMTSLILFFISYLAINVVRDEPFTFVDGISMWPTILLRWFVFFLAIFFIFLSIRSLNISFDHLTKKYYQAIDLPTLFSNKEFSFEELIKYISKNWVEKLTRWKLRSESIVIMVVIVVSVSVNIYVTRSNDDKFFDDLIAIILVLVVSGMTLFGEKIKSIRNWIEKDTAHSGGDLWKQYHEYGRLEHRVLRASIKFFVFMMVAALLYLLFPVLPPPCRGAVCDWEHVSRVVSFPVIMLLIFLVLDAQRLCLHWIEKIRNDLIKKRKEEFLVPKSLLTIITLVARRTRVVDRLIYYPLIVIMLMLIARINYFDNIAFPLHVGFTVILSISLLLYAGAKLRTEAVQLKRAAINCAKELSHLDRDAVIQEIQAIDYGAFEPLFAQPAIRSLLLTLGFVSLVVTEYFKLLE